jgi:hypothetical protein
MMVSELFWLPSSVLEIELISDLQQEVVALAFPQT